MEPGRRYLVRWLDEPLELELTFIKIDRGFFVFMYKKATIYLVARPSSIAIRPL